MILQYMAQDKELSRIPQGLNYNPDALFRVFGRESDIIRDLLVIASNQYSKDVFGNTILTIDDFTNLGHKRTELQRVIPEYSKYSKEEIQNLIIERRKQLGIDDTNNYTVIEMSRFVDSANDKISVHPFLGDHLCISKLDYALYRAYTEALRITRKSGDELITSEVKIIGSLKISSLNRVSKRKYQINVSSSWLNSLFNEYHLIDIKDYKSLQSGRMITTASYRNFYLFIGRIISQIRYLVKEEKGNSYIASIDDLCSIFNVDFKTPKNKKAYIKKALNDIKDSVSHSKFEWDFVNNNTKYSYFVEFKFDDDTLNYFDEKLKAVVLETFHKEAKTVFISLNRSKIQDHWSEEKRGDSIFNADDFYKWLGNNDEDKEIKEKLLKDAHDKVLRRGVLGNTPIQKVKSYIPQATIEATARSLKLNVDDVAKKNGYLKDDKGYYKYS